MRARRDPARGRIVDYVQSQGVLHHVSDPEAPASRAPPRDAPGGTGCVMVYNRDSVWFHLYVAYEQMVVEDDFGGL